MKFLTLSIEVLFVLLCGVKIEGETDWTFEIIEIGCNNKTPDKLDMKLYMKRIARGYFVVDGTVNIGIDLTDQTIMYSNVYYSPTGQAYTLTPFRIPQMPISVFINTFYKDFMMEGLKDCATNIGFNNPSKIFIPPVTKRVTVLENCTFPNENMPSHMKSGYYNITCDFINQVETSCSLLAQVEPK